MKILYYNWAPFNTPGVGGGVAVYMRNLFNYVASNNKDEDVQIYFISSGWFYDKKKAAYIREEKRLGDVRCFSIINSPISAPHRFAVSQLKDFFKENSLKSLFKTFIEENGPFDVIHFQSLEGLSPTVLELKKEFPNSRFIYSIHDYGLFCPNVRLWTDKGTNCYSDINKRDCSICMRADETARIRSLDIRLRPSNIDKNKDSSYLSRVKSGFVSRLSRFCGRLKKRNVLNDYLLFRENNIKMVNLYADAVLCVSSRVAEVANCYGVKKDLLRVCYIGTKVAETTDYKSRTDEFTDLFTILYMGYAAAEKGFFFLMDALDYLPNEFSSKTVIKLASKLDDDYARQRVEKLKERYNNIIIYDGYSHADFPDIMKDVNLGIVPPQWEDNLPQVTIEMIANGVPVLTSNYGGAHELNRHPDFVFNNREDFLLKIQKIKENRSILVDYWNYSQKLTTMDMHWKELKCIYQI